MSRLLRFGLIVLAMILATLPGATLAAAPAPYTCTGGAVPPGTYSTLTIAGVCDVPTGVVMVEDGLKVMPGAWLIALDNAADIHVDGGIWVGKDAVIFFGCSPSISGDFCQDTHYTVTGGIVVEQALAAVFHGNMIHGNVSVTGGGGGLTCFPMNPQLPPPYGFLPPYTDFENNHIWGGVTVSGVTSCWMGFLRNEVKGAVKLMNNNLLDPDAMEVTSNVINGSLICRGNVPAPQIGDAQNTKPNEVTGHKLGQCAAEGL